MALNALRLVRLPRIVNLFQNRYSNSVSINPLPTEEQVSKRKEYRTEQNLIYLEDPDSFGTLSNKVNIPHNTLDDEGDIREQEYLEKAPMRSQKLTIKQYADIIKQFLKHKRLKEAIDVLEVRMLTEDKVKPVNYIYNILIGGCAEVGYTRKAFKLYNEMKRRALKATGDTYTCLFEACANSPWTADGLKNAQHLRQLMIEKGIEPNLTNYNAMIKAFGQCGDLTTAFQIVDEMKGKKIKIRVHTFNHLLHACISDKESGLRHSILVWRKMLQMKEKPNIYSFNLMLKCVKECNLGSKNNIEELISIIQQETPLNVVNYNNIHIESINKNIPLSSDNIQGENTTKRICSPINDVQLIENGKRVSIEVENVENDELSSILHTGLSTTEDEKKLPIQFVNYIKTPAIIQNKRTIPNLLSRIIKMQNVLSLQEVHTIHDKFAIIGGQDDFLKEMESCSVKPDIKTMTQMLPLIEETKEAENKLIETMKSLQIETDIDFYNMLIRKRCLRSHYDDAFEVKNVIELESKARTKKRHPWNKKRKLKINIMTYGVLAMACKTKENAEKLLMDMKEQQLKVNIEILGTLLRQGTAHNKFGYIMYIMNVLNEEKLKPNAVFIKHLEVFNDKCTSIIKRNEHDHYINSEYFIKGYNKFLDIYNNWLKEIDVQEVLHEEHPWQQFRNNYPETVQRQNVQIVMPKKFYKRKYYRGKK